MFNKEKLIAFMNEKHLSAAEVARDLGVSSGMIRNITYGIKQPSLAMAVEFSDMIGCTVEDLVIRERI